MATEPGKRQPVDPRARRDMAVENTGHPEDTQKVIAARALTAEILRGGENRE